MHNIESLEQSFLESITTMHLEKQQRKDIKSYDEIWRGGNKEGK